MEKKINRIEVITSEGRDYVKYFDTDQIVEFSFQDDDKTLKIFLSEDETQNT